MTDSDAGATHRPVSDGRGEEGRLIAFRANSRECAQITPAPSTRDWIPETPGESARWCLPLTMANASGWEVLCPLRVTAWWDGGEGAESVHVTTSGETESEMYPRSEFGAGIVTFSIPYLFRTAPGFDLLVRGPVNRPKDAVSPLEGLVETDWAVMPFTMSWQLTRPDTPVHWEVGEPVCMLVPQRRGELEAITPEFRRFTQAPETRELTQQALAQRKELQRRYNILAAMGMLRTGRDRFERLYFRGRYPDDRRAPTHRATVRLRPFSA